MAANVTQSAKAAPEQWIGYWNDIQRLQVGKGSIQVERSRIAIQLYPIQKVDQLSRFGLLQIEKVFSFLVESDERVQCTYEFRRGLFQSTKVL